ncbi:MAG: 50S ribosomal protein L22, large subunit ribosomal protein L22 [Candidatus Moranbacteria bacterium GW2011_GWC1_45_18]|nr:MAG: 50S ribosomal protein L22 [Candidatus Moranbacteria bacterium GW2011_GWC2_40_12]KKT69650.1 MAG: 50S ribosomal protein L22 [Candidatus Moranbacteria bacterium GW2011_GWF1_44_4]KKT99772.1 MAG: 50S ribosomal protein L22, large subunit ribosomal protein L22 [Candidatus Moranbacteria bacterium GW2011_GWC1_45_18]OGI23891.1 MAG: 50S ribosomal protein L22 [Candidatus Moranbacteria bacterium RIFOXYA1_FULL_44_8]OGI34955.1 MAG: 50S ribosomal protein L22 [Candidatus Moranbacteria bacterium RIFOXYC1
MEIKAQLNNLRRSPRKIRLVAKMLSGLDVKEAENQLKFLIKGSTPNFEKLLKSAVSNAENNFGLSKDNLYVKNIAVNEGTKLKRWLPRAYGRASLILKRSSHIEMILAERVEGKDRKKLEKKHEIKDVKPEEIKERIEKGKEEMKEEKKEKAKERETKEFIDEKKKAEGKQGFLKRVFRRKSM